MLQIQSFIFSPIQEIRIFYTMSLRVHHYRSGLCYFDEEKEQLKVILKVWR